jgi:putative sterol carrier protein
MFVKVDGRATAVEALDDPSVEVWAESTTFLLLCAGRIDPQTAIDRGRIRWTGDATWGEKAARNLRFTI